MIYRDFHGKKISALGMGGMRFPVVDGDYGKIDMPALREMISYAVENGVNYFDTAWGYHKGNSEYALGEILSEYPRDKFYLANKFPGYDNSNFGKVEEIFEKQLEKCKVDYFDFYLFHNVSETNIDLYLDPQYRTREYLIEQKKKGRIKHLGFSVHGTLDTTKRFLEVYGNDIEFCQVQLNWLDWTLQNARKKVELLREMGIPVWVMEPVRGGKLVSIPQEYEDMLKKMRPDAPVVEWAFRFLQTIPEVTVTLSGMSNIEQLKDNIATFKNEKPLNSEEWEMILGVAEKMTSKTSLPCTACRYCITHCPMELDIPHIIEMYNEHVYWDRKREPVAMSALPDDKKPSACIGCRSCEGVCPQNILISEMMTAFTKRIVQ